MNSVPFRVLVEGKCLLDTQGCVTQHTHWFAAEILSAPSGKPATHQHSEARRGEAARGRPARWLGGRAAALTPAMLIIIVQQCHLNQPTSPPARVINEVMAVISDFP